MCHVRPPLRTERDRDALRAGLQKGILNTICSDHQPQDVDAKLAPFSETEPGISGLETLLPLSLRLVEDGLMSLQEVLGCLTCNPADVLGINAGRLVPGGIADICIYDPERYWSLSSERFVSRGHNSPFLNWELKGCVTHTILQGQVVYDLDSEDE
jgi:dihydroorotase